MIYDELPNDNKYRYPFRYEFLFPNQISMKKYAIGLSFWYRDKHYEKNARIIKKKYPKIKIFYSDELEHMPKLFDVIDDCIKVDNFVNLHYNAKKK